MTTALALEHRPKTWEELVGQDIPRRLLTGMLHNGVISPGYLFTGSSGCGKTSAAFLFAKRLLCLEPEGVNPCNACRNCRSAETDNSHNMLYVKGGTDRSLDFVKKIIIKTLEVAPVGASHRVVIIDEVHQYKRDAMSPFLTLLEKMPKHSVLIFCTTEADKVLPEVANRCTPIIFSPLPSNTIIDRIRGIFPEMSDEVLDLLATRCSGSFRKVWSILDSWLPLGEPLTEPLIRKLMGSVSNLERQVLWTAVKQGNTSEVQRTWKRWMMDGVQPRQLGLDLMDDLIDELTLMPYDPEMAKALGLLSGCTLVNETSVWLPAILSMIPLFQKQALPCVTRDLLPEARVAWHLS